MKIINIKILIFFLCGCGETQKPVTTSSTVSYGEFKRLVFQYFELYMGDSKYEYFDSDFDAAFENIKKSKNTDLTKLFIEMIGLLDFELRQKIKELKADPTLDINNSYSSKAIRFAAACRILARSWLPTTEIEATQLLEISRKDRSVQQVIVVTRAMLSRCHAVPDMLRAEPCSLRVLLASISDQIIIARLKHNMETRTHLETYMDIRFTVPKSDEARYGRIFHRLMNLYSRVFFEPNISAEDLLLKEIEPLTPGVVRAEFGSRAINTV